MSSPNINLSNLDGRYSKPADVAAAISAQAVTDAGQYLLQSNGLQKSSNLLDVASPSAALTNLGAAKKAVASVSIIDYGADPTYTTDSTTAFQNAVATLTAGGELLIPNGTYRVTGTIPITKPIIIRGTAPRGIDGSNIGAVIITPTAVSGPLFTVSADNTSFRDINITNYDTQANTNTALSSAIRFTTGRQQSVTNCRINNFYIGVDWQNCDFWRMSGNVLSNCSQYSVRIANAANPDSGDSLFDNNLMRGSTTGSWITAAHIRQESGGGTKFSNNKILGGALGAQLAPTDGVATSIWMWSNNSIEGQTVSNIDVILGGPTTNNGAWARIVFTGNQLTGNLCTSHQVYFHPSVAGQISEVIIADNKFNSATASINCLYVDAVSNISITGNQFSGGYSKAIFLGSSTRNWTYDTNHFTGTGITIQNAAYYQWAWSTGSSGEMKKSTYIYNASTASAFRAALVGVVNPSSFVIDVVFSGVVNGGSAPGPVGGKFQRMVLQSASGATPTLTTIGTDTQVGSPFVINFATSTNTIDIGVLRSTSDGSATAVIGTAYITVTGAAYSIL